ncbi:hypothetical protein [Amycolatopsis sp. NPDC004625]|uniref:hypothetical protein n=1 Tax=Amycolatopsis sp. NPDC004625 TaxID=3154670 RepID=UPI0033BD4CD2
MYCLETVIAGDEVLRRLAGDVVDARIVALHGSLSLLPMTDEYFDAVAVRGSPISQALRALGVRRGSHLDEFDAAGLGRHRRTEDWLVTPNE